ncbi:leucine-tRNA ligase [Multifurca ochricompacta]|uniref:leucine--tRNA ligase n=1 Tax=Multifurca ochricompacta TaxID=376703 RepID=A0AAD4QMS0_9AGAM|nr:leucine-tRNA ligase [Multifurca ochricompacta]
MSNTIELAQTGKRDYLKSLEKKYQEEWEQAHIFETDAPAQEETAGLTPAEIHQRFPKWFGNFPYPYMNGSLHLGHAFTISKIEFAAGYHRLLGKRVLFPHGFHVTGMPIKASADKIIREMEMFGQDFEDFNTHEQDVDEEPAAGSNNLSAPRVDKGKKGKLTAKSTGYTYQFQIMESIGVPRSEIKKFADPYYWLTYFPPIAVEDHLALGTRIDWRRSFMTTPANPYYDSFVHWQMNKLHALGKIKFGERYTIYSPKDGQPCMDHDRADGEGIGPQEYTGIKMEVVEWSPAAHKVLENKLGGRKVFLVAATLRPETMYGQTNCFVGTAIKYGVFAANDKEAYVCTLRAARNMTFQGTFDVRGQVNQLAELEGTAIVGAKIKAPFSVYPQVYVLPMDNVLPTKGTGVVTSVPSDSPDDYATLMDLRKKAEYYKIDPVWAAFDPVPVLSTPAYGDMSAPALVKQLKIVSQKDVKQLAEAKELAYKEGFYNGTMLAGEFKGEPVQEAKNKVRASMIGRGVAFAYAEPEGLVISRSADECVVALMDQWYLDYGEPKWRSEAERLLARMNTYFAETRNGFEGTLAWLNQWACARTYGLGSVLPWDPQFLVESLSDSTIYMCYYTVAHLLHGSIDGKVRGKLDIGPEQMTDEIWEYVLVDGPWPNPSPLPKEKADALKHEYEYFYPFDVRSSGKDLINNHCPSRKWPLSMRANGHLLLNGQKMSKSKGNSLTLREGVEKFGADATRLALADAGDGIEDANFEEKNANANILRIHTLLTWCEVSPFGRVDEMTKDGAGLRTGPKDSTFYKDAMKYGFYELQSVRDWYREVTADIGMHVDLVKHWIRVAALLASPIAPHFAEHIWLSILHQPPHPTRTLADTFQSHRRTDDRRGRTVRDAELTLLKKLGKAKGGPPPFDPKKPRAVRVYVATRFPEWQDACVQAVQAAWSPEAGRVDDAKVRALLTERGLIKDKRAMPFVQLFKKRIADFGAESAFKRTLPFVETDVLREILPYLKRTLTLVDVEVLSVEEALAYAEAGKPGYSRTLIESSEPGSPAFELGT